MEKGEKFGVIDSAGKGKAAAGEKGKRVSHQTRIRMDFDPKTSRLFN